MICSWCHKAIDRSRHPHVVNTVPLDNGGKFEYRYHAEPCYRSWREFILIHEWEPLLPESLQPPFGLRYGDE